MLTSLTSAPNGPHLRFSSSLFSLGSPLSLLGSGHLFYISDDSLLFSCLIDALGALIYSLLYSRTERKERERA